MHLLTKPLCEVGNPSPNPNPNPNPNPTPNQSPLGCCAAYFERLTGWAAPVAKADTAGSNCLTAPVETLSGAQVAAPQLV